MKHLLNICNINGAEQYSVSRDGRLFDGSGGFPLAGEINGIKPVWASEVEPYPIAVTKSRFTEGRCKYDPYRITK